MNTKNRGRMWLILTFFALTACTGPQNQPSPTFSAGQESVVPDTPQADMPNPAAAACVEQGFVSEIRAAADGSQYGVCIFPDGSECDEWAYYRGECGPASQNGDISTPTGTPAPVADMPNPASAFCQEQGYQSEIRTATDGSQYGVCIFPDGSECDEWAYYRGECGPTSQNGNTPSPTVIPTALPIDPSLYQGWWTYTHAVYGFSIMLPEDWIVEEIAATDPLLGGHLLNLHPQDVTSKENIRLTFRRVGEETLLWPTGVGQGEFVTQGALDMAGQPAQRVLLVCPTGEVTAIWYHQGEGQPNITRGDLEFGFIFTAATHCEAGYSLSGTVQQVGETILASLNVP